MPLSKAEELGKAPILATNTDIFITTFSGGKDSTVTADIVTKALGNPSLVHIFGNTTLEFPQTVEYVKRFKKDHPFAIFETSLLALRAGLLLFFSKVS